MTSITALLHTHNDALRLGRALETVYACDHILIVDHGSEDSTVRVARDYGATVMSAAPGATVERYVRSAPPGWVLCLDPCESLTEKLSASLFEWKSESGHTKAPAFSVFLREETAEGWVEVPSAETRLVPQNWGSWNERFPVHDPSSVALEGELLRFVFP
jgi:glycosyltransferase involved in cell wall biosynthesis